jgi:hypothetical protein
MRRCLTFFRLSRPSRLFPICKHYFMLILLLCSVTYILLKIKLLIDYHNASRFHQIQQYNTCKRHINQTEGKAKVILFWTKIFSSRIDENYVNNVLFTPSGRCGTDQCKVTNNRSRLCESNAVIFHARGGINMQDMPKERLSHQRYVLLTKEPPYKTTAIVGYLNSFFNWTATVSICHFYEI